MSSVDSMGVVADEGLVHAVTLDGNGGGTELGWSDLSEQGTARWIHLERTHDRTREWLTEQAGLRPIVVDALLAEETRPRAISMPGGVLVTLRGVNLNPGANPEDMISLRAWIEENRLITLRRRRVMAIQDVRADIAEGTGPKSVAGIFVAIVHGLVARAGAVVEEVEDAVGEAEDKLLTSAPAEMRRDLNEGRRVAIMLRRYFAPQRDTLSRLASEHAALFEQADIHQLKESSDGMLRLVEDLDAARDRAAVLHEELAARLTDAMNRNMYLLSIVASIFLPLGLVTGLFGINVGGMPWIESPLGFAYVCGSLVVLGAIQFWLLKRLGILT